MIFKIDSDNPVYTRYEELTKNVLYLDGEFQTFIIDETGNIVVFNDAGFIESGPSGEIDIVFPVRFIPNLEVVIRNKEVEE